MGVQTGTYLPSALCILLIPKGASVSSAPHKSFRISFKRPLQPNPQTQETRTTRERDHPTGLRFQCIGECLSDSAFVERQQCSRRFIGRENIGTFFAAAWKTCGGLRLVPTSANGQPAFAIYEFSDADKGWNAHSIHALTLENDVISAVTLFLEPRLVCDFGLPQFLPDDTNSGLRTPSHNA